MIPIYLFATANQGKWSMNRLQYESVNGFYWSLFVSRCLCCHPLLRTRVGL